MISAKLDKLSELKNICNFIAHRHKDNLTKQELRQLGDIYLYLHEQYKAISQVEQEDKFPGWISM